MLSDGGNNNGRPFPTAVPESYLQQTRKSVGKRSIAYW